MSPHRRNLPSNAEVRFQQQRALLRVEVPLQGWARELLQQLFQRRKGGSMRWPIRVSMMKGVPCGCEQRKEIMFTSGAPDLTLALVVGVPLALLLTIVYFRKGA